MKKVIKLIIAVFVLGFIANAPVFVFGSEDIDDAAVNAEVKEINVEIKSRRDQIKEIEDKQEAYKRAIKQKQAEKASLNNQMAILENRIAKAELDIESAEIGIDRTNLEIKKVGLEIEDKDKKIAKEKEHIESILRLMHKEDGKTALEIILLNDSLTDFINQVKYLGDINKEIGDSVNKLKQYKEELEAEQTALADKKRELEELKKELDDKRQALVGEQENKFFVLEQTRSSEKEYQRLLKLAKQEQEQAAAEIVSLEKTVREKIAKMQDKKLEFNDAGLIWPVPKNTITSYFHDPDYPFRYIFEHPAIDIRAGQGTALRAAASGYVARAKDAGKGYSYIMIIHGDGLATVYGHVSAIYVKEDEYVVQGQAIGRSGGLPGTPGAGRLTTGPHLHFEVRLNGIPVNPLEYLP